MRPAAAVTTSASEGTGGEADTGIGAATPPQRSEVQNLPTLVVGGALLQPPLPMATAEGQEEATAKAQKEVAVEAQEKEAAVKAREEEAAKVLEEAAPEIQEGAVADRERKDSSPAPEAEGEVEMTEAEDPRRSPCPRPTKNRLAMSHAPLPRARGS